MSSSTPILIAVFALVAAAFWYDASVASASAPDLRATRTEAR
jgi:hypothetical protein